MTTDEIQNLFAKAQALIETSNFEHKATVHKWLALMHMRIKKEKGVYTDWLGLLCDYEQKFGECVWHLA